MKTGKIFRCCPLRQFMLLVLFLVLLPTVLSGQEVRRQILRTVDIDSIVFFDTDQNNLRAAALNVDTALRPLPLRQMTLKEARRALKKLKNTEDIKANPVSSAVGRSLYAAADDLQLAVPLLQWTGNSRFADDVESLLLNNFLPALNVSSMDRHIAARQLLTAAQMAYMTDETGVFLNLYVNSYARIRTASLHCSLDVQTTMPFSPRVKIRVGDIQPQTPITLRLRLPFWQLRQNRLPALYINGHEEDRPVENGYFVIQRRWNNGDEVFFDFDLDAEVLSSDAHYLRLGSVLYYSTEEMDANRLQLADEDNEMGHPLIQSGKVVAQPLMDLQP